MAPIVSQLSKLQETNFSEILINLTPLSIGIRIYIPPLLCLIKSILCGPCVALCITLSEPPLIATHVCDDGANLFDRFRLDTSSLSQLTALTAPLSSFFPVLSYPRRGVQSITLNSRGLKLKVGPLIDYRFFFASSEKLRWERLREIFQMFAGDERCERLRKNLPSVFSHIHE